MKYKKILILIACLIFVVSCAGSVFGSNFLDTLDITPFSEDTVVNIDDYNFTIPKGYGESDITNDTNKYGITTIQYIYFNDDADQISVTVIYNGSSITVNDFDTDGYVSKNLAGKTGMYQNKDGEVGFFYIEDNTKYVKVTAPDDAVLVKVISGK